MQFKMDVFCVFHLGVPPTQDSSQRQDYSIFSRGHPKPSFATVDPMFHLFFM